MSLPIAECRSRHHRYADETGLRCKLFKTDAELPCARFELDPPLSPAESPAHRVWYEADEQGRGD